MAATEELIREIGLLSYIGVFGVALISNVVIPVPEEVIIIIFGYLAAGPRFSLPILLAIIIAGLLLSDLVMYWLARKGAKIVTFFYNKIFSKRLADKEAWMERHMNKIIFFSRFMIQLRFLGPFLAGQKKVPLRRFVFLDLAALLIYTPAYLLVGFYFRSRINYIIDGVNEVKNIVIVVIVAALLFSGTKLLSRYLTRK